MHSFGHAYKAENGHPLTAREKAILDAIKPHLVKGGTPRGKLLNLLAAIEKYLEGKETSIHYF